MQKFELASLSDTYPLVIRIKDVLENATKQKVAILMVDKLRKVAGVAIKDVSFTLENGQSLILTFRKDGDVIKTQMNNKNIPLANVMDYDDQTGFMNAIELIALKIKANQPKFDLARTKKKVEVPNDPSKRAKSLKIMTADTLKSLDELNQQIDEKRQILAAKTTEYDTLVAAQGAA